MATIRLDYSEYTYPLHPGVILRELCLKSLGLTLAQAAQGLGVSRTTLSKLLCGHLPISTDIANRLKTEFGIRAETWICQQAQYDHWRSMADVAQ